jgi:phosphate transport system ATP-binding protein
MNLTNQQESMPPHLPITPVGKKVESRIHIGENARTPSIESLPVKMAADDLSVYYGKFRALKDISIEIPENKITALISPSGCGKSTLLRSFNRMNDLVNGSRVTGQVLLNGKNIYEPGVDVVDIRQRVGMVFQRPNPFPMSIFDNVAYGPRLYGIHKKYP